MLVKILACGSRQQQRKGKELFTHYDIYDDDIYVYEALFRFRH